MNKNQTTAMVTWLIIINLLILTIIAVGGITRLTDSGLSMVDWKPIMGAIPPIGETQWQETFEQYKQFPQYKVVNHEISLQEFKSIFFWEYIHRLLGRIIGLVFFFPFLFFMLRGYAKGKLAAKLWMVFILGGAQGLLGWYMVKSGLVDRPFVSHYRLAAHLSVALLLFCYVVWVICSLTPFISHRHPSSRPAKLPKWGWIITALIAVQIVYGAFVAGLDAGYAFNTFPKMMHRWLPPGGMALEPAWKNFFDNAATVQFIHRVLGVLTLFGVAGFWSYGIRQRLNHRQQTALHTILVLTSIQFLLGLATLVLQVPLLLASLHQIAACLLIGSCIYLNYNLSDYTRQVA